MIKIKFIKDFNECKIGQEFEASKKSAESAVKNGYAEYIEEPKEELKNLSKQTISKLIHKEAEKIREENPKIKEIYEQTKKYEEEGNPLLNPPVEKKVPVKLSFEDVSKFIKLWSTEGFTPKTIYEIKETSKNSDFTISELKQFVNNELKVIFQKKKLEKPKQEKVLGSPTKLKYLDLIRDKKWGDATELLAKYIVSKYKIYTTKEDLKSEVWIYKEGIYVSQGKSQIREALRKLLGKYYSQWIYGRVMEKVEPDTFIELNEFFNINYVDEVPVNNGILNVITKELKPFDENKIFFNKLPVKYNPSKDCPSIEKHLKDVLKSEEDIKVVYELIGFLLYKDYFLEKMFMLVGDGRNGKGKTIDLIRRFLGVENCASVPLAAINDDNFRISELFGKMANLAGDLSNTSLKDTGMLKQTTGRDLLGAKRKFLNDIRFINYAKHLFACNDLPKVYDMSKGFWSRWLVLEFPYEFIHENEYEALDESKRMMKKILDPYHIDKISSDDELSGLLNKALEGLERIRNNKTFSYSKGTEDVKKFWIRKSDSFVSFCFDNLEESSEERITKAELRKTYHKYCSKHKLKGCSDKAMAITLQEMFGVVDGKVYHEGVTTHLWEGIKFKLQSKYNKNIGELAN